MSESQDTWYQGGGSQDGGWRKKRAPNITLNEILLVFALALGAFLGCESGPGDRRRAGYDLATGRRRLERGAAGRHPSRGGRHR
jgi:hypothetical protein